MVNKNQVVTSYASSQGLQCKQARFNNIPQNVDLDNWVRRECYFQGKERLQRDSCGSLPFYFQYPKHADTRLQAVLFSII